MNSCLAWDLREAAGTGHKDKRAPELLPLHWCGHRKDLKPQLMGNQSLEGREEVRREGKEPVQDFPSSPCSALAAARFVLSFHLVPSFPGLSDLALPPQSRMSFQGSLFSHHYDG